MSLRILSILLLFKILVVSSNSQCDSQLCICSSNTCSTCLSILFYIDPANHTCKLCDHRCGTCTSSLSCNSCLSGFYLNGGQCIECPIFCSTCSGKICQKCMDGYAIVNGQCKQCLANNVLTCDSLVSVSTCQQGFWKNGDSCSPCRQFCQECTSSTNCLNCKAGYRVEVSAGTYCSACPLGCYSCSSSACTTCLANYRLVGGVCQSLITNCSLISNCRECQTSSNNIVICKVCKYPYYLNSSGICVIGTSLLCSQGASGPTRYQCLGSCQGYSRKLDSLKEQIVCAPTLWLSGTDIQQYYVEASTGWNKFNGGKLQSGFCGGIDAIYSNIFTGPKNILTLNHVFPPYYKLNITIRLLPLYKSYSPSSNISLKINMKDNSTSIKYDSINVNTSQFKQCTSSYITVQSKKIQDQNVTISFESELLNGSVEGFQMGLVGYLEILTQIYVCASECRICSNSRYCLECYGTYFVYQNQCVSSCFGYYQYYAPLGNPQNYTFKQCVQKCPQAFYGSLNPSKTDTYMCVKCQQPCKTCKSQSQCLSCVQPYLFFEFGFQCVLVCQKTHYNLSGICVPCGSPCRTCEGVGKCLSCSVGYLNGNGTCTTSCPIGLFANLTSRECESCTQSCVSCTNSAGNCLSCKSGYLLLGNSCIQSCPALTHYALNGICHLCKAPCLLCSDQTSCNSCISGFLLNNSCLNSCPAGFYSNLSKNICSRCPSAHCKLCSSPTFCEACESGFYLSNGQCVSLCPERSYGLSQQSVCASCTQPCYSCLNSTYCVSCQMGYLSVLKPGSCINVCEDGYYPQGSGSLPSLKICSVCSSQCRTCQNYTSCLSCSDANKFLTHDNRCVIECSLGYFSKGTICQLCSYPCLTCKTSAQLCVSCHQPYILRDEVCVSQCGTFQFQNNRSCYPCLSPCRTCNSSDFCFSCVTGQSLYLYNGSCISSCPALTYADPLTQKCRPCNSPCLTCSQSNQCLTCSTGYLNPDKKRCQSCPSGTFPNQITKQCQFCNSTIQHCTLCSSQTACRSCGRQYYLKDGICLGKVQCQQFFGFYANQQQMACLPCISPCGQCLSQSQCSSCLSGFLSSSKCVLECPKGQYSDILSRTCMPCNLSLCLTCTSTPTTCLSCDLTSSLGILFPSESRCISSNECPQEYYIDSSYSYPRCIKCQSPCLTCVSARTCTGCLSGILNDGECRSSCPVGFYETQNACQPCDNNCLRCRGSSNYCISCSQDKYLQGSICVDGCSDQYYFESSTLTCKSCLAPCKTCLSASECLSCLQSSQGNALPSNIIYYGQCLQVCPDGTYQKDLSCIKCPSQCQFCSLTNSSQVICKKCSINLFMNSTNPGKCSSNCSLSQYPDSYTRNCYSCQSPCVSCLSATICKSCENGYIIFNGDCVKGGVCPEGSFKVQRLNDIERCEDRCQQPLYGDTFIHECVESCLYSYVKFDDQRLCLKECPVNFYLDSEFLCKKCIDNGCDNLLEMGVRAKSIFNVLYVRVSFSHDVDLSIFLKGDVNELIQIQLRELDSIYSSKRMLQNAQQLSFSLNPITSTNTLWLQLKTVSSLGPTQIKLSLKNYYIFATQILQNTNSTAIISSFDQYSSQEKESALTFESYSKVLSIIMCILFLINLISNTGYLVYSMVDFYQLLFLMVFLDVDLPPILNHFLFGFKYAHYLFLPQIFGSGAINTMGKGTPDKFGVVVADAGFLNNTGHDFLIMFIVAGIFIVVKIVDFSLNMFVIDNRSNKIKNQQDNGSPQQSEQMQNQKPSQSQSSQTSYEKDQSSVEGKSKVLGFVRTILNRIRWNYLNDFIYILYFYLMLFTFTQMHDMSVKEGIHYASNIFAVVFAIVGIAWPFALAVLLYKRNSNQQIFIELSLQQQKEYEKYHEEYKCFVANIKQKESNIFGLMIPPIKYFKKLLLAILFAFCSNYENFIMGVIITFSILFVVISLLYRPFKNKLQLFSNCAFQVLFTFGCICLCVLMISDLGFTIQNKNGLAKAAIAFFVILSIAICLYNSLMVILQGVEYWTGTNYLEKYEEVDSDVDIIQQKSNGDPRISISEESNIRLNIGGIKRFGNEQQNEQRGSMGKKSLNGASISSDGLGIYLKRDPDHMKAAPFLIKCIKGPNFDEDSKSEQENEQEVSQCEEIEEKESNNQEQVQKSERKQTEDEPKGTNRYQQNSISFQDQNVDDKANSKDKSNSTKNFQISNVIQVSDGGYQCDDENDGGDFRKNQD